LLFEPRDHRGLDGDLQAEGDRRRTRLRAEAQRRMAAVDFLASRGMGEAQGKKVDPSAVAAQAIEAQPSFGQIKPSEAAWLARSDSSEEKTWRISSNLHKRPAT